MSHDVDTLADREAARRKVIDDAHKSHIVRTIREQFQLCTIVPPVIAATWARNYANYSRWLLHEGAD